MESQPAQSLTVGRRSEPTRRTLSSVPPARPAPPRVADTLPRRLLRKLRSWFSRPAPANDRWAPAGGPVLVIAPHPDDEVIGCGGTMLRHAGAGDDVTVIYLTRGESSRGFPWLTPAQRQGTREAEARASCHVLGVKEALFLDGVDGRVGDADVTHALTVELATLIHSRKPKVVYVPHADDNHVDHAAAYAMIVDVVRHADWRPTVYQYELWSPLDADFAVDVSDQMKRKLKAIKRHHLALDAFNYVPTMLGLAAYRSGTVLQRKGYAEAFKRTTL